MLSRSLELSLGLAVREAQNRHHEYLCVEHLLYILCDDKESRDILSACGADMLRLKKRLDAFLRDEVEQIPGLRIRTPHQSSSFERLLQRAFAHVHFSGREKVDPGDIIASIFEEADCFAAYYLQQEGVTRLDVLEFISHGEVKTVRGSDDTSAKGGKGASDARDPLEAFTINLSKRAAEGRIDPLIGRRVELKRICQALCRRRKNNPILVGEPGVGKTALAEGLALHIYEGKAPAILQSAEVLQLDLAGMLAGTKYRGDFEQRLKSVIARIIELKDTILFIDEIHTIVGAGATSDSSVDASNILKPVLASGELRCIGSTTFEEYKNIFEKDRALSRRFQRIDLDEPSTEEAIRIVEGLISRYEEHHGVHYTKSAIRAAVELAVKHINDRRLPDKAIDVIDEAGAEQRMAGAAAKKVIRPRDIERIVAEISKAPIRSVVSGERERLAHLEDDIRARVYGQDAAIAALAKCIKRSRAGLGQPEKPLGSFLFTGPTGVGKTEAARQLANVMGIHFARYDMSEYMEKHAVSRLIGAPPGYVGFEQGGLLTDELRRHPHCVLLLDEIEKAHADLYNILLQVMDHATLTDNAGRKADFRNAVLIMTSNAGARDMAGQSIGFGRQDDDPGDRGAKAVEKTFAPEFRNRLDAIITFHALTLPVMEQVVDKFMDELQGRLAVNKVRLTISPAARAWFATHGHDSRYGARPLARLIQVHVVDRLSDELLFGSLRDGGAIYIDTAPDGAEEPILIDYPVTAVS